MGLSIWHILVVLLVVMLVFGTKRLPGAMEDMAKGLKAFKKGLHHEDDAPGILPRPSGTSMPSDLPRTTETEKTTLPRE